MKIEKILRKTQKELKVYVDNYLRSMGYTTVVRDGFVYASGEIPVLLVAHLDTVHRTLPETIYYSKNKRKLMCAEGIGGDDRCGVYMILNLVSELKCHVLFCEDEEIGGVGANKFASSGIVPIVNYIIEFDRKGADDAVFYDCDNKDFTDFITSFGFREAYGSFSDISILAPSFGVAAVNLSSGYYNAHTNYEYINLDNIDSVLEKAKKIIQTKSNKFEYVESRKYLPAAKGYYSNYNYDYSNSNYRNMIFSSMVKPITEEDNAYLYDFESDTMSEKIYSSMGIFIDKQGNAYGLSDEHDVLIEIDGSYVVNEYGESILYSELKSAGRIFNCCYYDDYLMVYGY